MELIPAVEFPNFDINIAMNTQSGHFQQGGATMRMRLLQISKFVYTLQYRCRQNYDALPSSHESVKSVAESLIPSTDWSIDLELK